MFGQETGVLYQYETSSGIKWKTFGNEKAQQKYESKKRMDICGSSFMDWE